MSAASAPVTLAELRRVDLFDGVDDAQLAEWLAVAQPQELAPGELIVEEQHHVPGLILLLEGTAATHMTGRGRPEPVGRQVAPTWIGAISVLTEDPLPVRIVAERACRLAIVPSAEFLRLVFTQQAVHQTVIRRIAPVMQRLTGIEQNRERLASLGTMAAGLAHELNNPAAAARRAASQLREEVGIVQSTLVKFVKAGVERADAEVLVELQQEALARAAGATALQTLDASDAEDALLDLLEELGVPEAWRLAEPLAAAGVDQAWLDRVAAHAGKATPAALHWVAATLTIGRVSVELCESTDRISALVSAVKSYAYMDRGGLVEVDLHEGLETTLTVLNHKLKHTSICVKREYDRTLPKLTVHGSELNQVWTNLLDNAIGALGEDGTITIRTRSAAGYAIVEFGDDGPGVPEDVRERIFDPFFTTKDVGAGTGLGLATARQIVVERHNGLLSVESAPGNTTFRVKLPLTAPCNHDPIGGRLPHCTHLDFVKVTELPAVSLGCEDCLVTGDPWCHLRICLTCGHVACCDDSPNRHATAHAAVSGHPLIRSIQPGEDWSWCFVDEVAFRLPAVVGEPRIPPSPMGCP